MNTISHLIAKILLIGILSLTFNTVYSSNKNRTFKSKKDSCDNLQIQGRIVVKNKNLKGSFKVEVMYFNSVTSSFTVKNNKSVKFLLKKDSPYVLKISKKGFIPRYICINTSVHETKNSAVAYNFYFETDFIETAEAMRLDDEALELPVALIAYDKKTGNFDHNKDYSLFVKQKIYSGLNEMSQMNVKN